MNKYDLKKIQAKQVFLIKKYSLTFENALLSSGASSKVINLRCVEKFK